MIQKWLTWLFLLGAFGLALAALKYSSWVHFTRGTHAIFVQVNDVEGLREGTEILMAGFQVGEVAEIRVLSQPQLRFDLELQVRNDIPIPEGTVAVMVSRGFGGGRVLALRPPADVDRAPILPGARLEARSEPVLSDVISRADEAFRALGELASDLKSFTGAGDSGPGLRQTLDRFAGTLRQIDKTLASAQAAMDRLDRTAVSVESSFSKGLEEFSETMKSVEDVAQDLESVIVEEKATIDSVLSDATERLAQLERVLSGLEGENLREFYSAMENLDIASRDFRILMDAMKNRPLHTLRKGVPNETEAPKTGGSMQE